METEGHLLVQLTPAFVSATSHVSFCPGFRYKWLTMLNSRIKLPKRNNMICPVLHHNLHVSLASLGVGCLWVKGPPLVQSVVVHVACPPMHVELPRTTGERNGGQAWLLPPQEAVGGAGIQCKD